MRRKTLLSNIKSIISMMFNAAGIRSWLLPRTQYNYKRDVGDGFGSSVVMAPIFWITRTFPEAPIAVKIGDEIKHEHDMLTLLKKPNDFYSGHILLMATLISFNVNGNAYWLKVRNGQNKVIQLWYVPHWMIEPKWPVNGTEFINHYDYIPDGKRYRIEIIDIVHFRNGIDPQNTRLGMAPLASLFREIFTDDEAANFSASLLKNMGIPGLVVSPKENNIMPDDAKATKEWFKKKFAGDRKGEPLVMRGPTDVKQFAFSPQEMDLSRLREIPEERVTAILGIPAAVVGFGTGLQQTKVGATMKELREMAYESCIIPMQRLIASELDNQLLIDFETKKNVQTCFDLSEVRVLQEDQNSLAKRQTRLTDDGIITVAEARAKLGYEVKPEHEIYFRKINIIEVPAGKRLPLQIEQEKRLLIETKAAAWQQQIILQLNRELDHFAGIWEKELVKIFEDLGKTVARIYRRLAKNRNAETKNIEDEVFVDLLWAALFAEIGKESLDELVVYEVHFLNIAKQTFKSVSSIMGVGINLTDEAEYNILKRGGKHLGLLDIDENTKKAIFNSLAEGRELGEGAEALARRIRNQVSAGPWGDAAARSKVIARTEAKYAQNISSLEAYKEAGNIEMIEIVDGQLPTSCQACIDRNGSKVSFDEADSIAIDEHPNGTLSFIPVLRS